MATEKPQISLPVLQPPTGMPEVLEEREDLIASEFKRELDDDFLSKYTSKFAITDKPDRLDERYFILPNQPLLQFDSKLAKAYMAMDETNSERLLYALICSSFVPARQKVVQTLKSHPQPNSLTIVAEGIVKVSALNEERYVVIFEQPKGKLLSEIIAAQTQPFSDRYIVERVIAPLVSALTMFEEQGITHGRINPENIYIGATLTLGECVSEPCGFSQDFHFEPINRIQATPAGKGEGHISHDYYALGVLVALMKRRPRPLQDPDQDRFVRRLLSEGSYLGIIGYADLSDEMSDLLRGTLNDGTHDRWTSKQLKPWITGKRFNLLIPTIPSLGSRPFELNGTEYQNLKQLSHAITKSWEQALPVIRDGTLAKWVEQSTRKREVAEYLNRTVSGYSSRTGKAVHEMITRFLFALDSSAPIRMKNLATHADGVGTLFAYLYHEKDDAALNQLGNIIEQSIISNWLDVLRRIFNTEISDEIQQKVTSIDKMRLYMRTQGMGFGPERMLYELNPSLPCQSPILKGYYCSTLKHLLIALDNIAGQKNRAEFPIDKHIAAFIGAKTSLTRDLKFTEFSAYPALARHKGLMSLKFLNQAQMQVHGMILPGLSGWCTSSFLDAIGTLHSTTIREQMCTAIRSLVYSGQFAPMVDYLTSFDYSEADANGFHEAASQYAIFTDKIRDLRNEELRAYKAHILGSTIAKFLAYGILLIMILYFYFGE